MSQLGDLLRETVRNTNPNPNTNNTIIGLLRERMELETLQPNNHMITTSTIQLKQRFRVFKPHFCCGWSRFDDDQVVHVDSGAPDESPPPPPNLAEALEAERQMVGTPGRVSLMRLLEETASEKEERGSDRACCVCMGREKGAALIPCGHTFCRVCSREVWVNRGFCPLCNRPILDVLHIF